MLNYLNLEKSLVIVSPPYFVHGFIKLPRIVVARDSLLSLLKNIGGILPLLTKYVLYLKYHIKPNFFLKTKLLQTFIMVKYLNLAATLMFKVGLSRLRKFLPN